MEKPSFKLVGAPCGQHGQYTFYKALRLTGVGTTEKIIAIGDFFFVRVWQDSELVSIGELQLLWTDRVSDQTLVSLRLYFLPENTPEGRNQHGEDEVLAINDKVVVRADDLLSWMCSGSEWHWGLKAVWKGACAPPAEPRRDAPLHHTKLDFSDVHTEKNTIEIDKDAPGVVVFSYPRYCRYRALVARLEGIQADWLRDSLVAALGGYAAPTSNTRILYCKDTFEYPELEGHEFVCNHLAPRLKGRPRGRRRRVHSPSPLSDREHSGSPAPHNTTLRRPSLRNGAQSEEEEEEVRHSIEVNEEDKAFLQQLSAFYSHSNEPIKSGSLKHLSLRTLYGRVISRGGYEAVCRRKLWRTLALDQPATARANYERYLLPFENHQRLNGKINGRICSEPRTIATIDVTDSPLRDDDVKVLRTPSPNTNIDCETGEITKQQNYTNLGKIEGKISPNLGKIEAKYDPSLSKIEDKYEPNLSKTDNKYDPNLTKMEAKYDSNFDHKSEVKSAEQLNREFLESLPKEERAVKISVKPVEKLIEPEKEGQNMTLGYLSDIQRVVNDNVPSATPLNGHSLPSANTDLKSVRPAGGSSLRHVRVKPQRAALYTPQPVSESVHQATSPPGSSTAATPATAATTTLNNFGIHHPPANILDDDIVEVPYKPKTPEIIDLDEYPESPQAVKKKKLDILKERGLEVTALPPWPNHPPLITPPIILNPAVQHQIMTQAQIFQMYNIMPQTYNANGIQPPKVIQGSSIFGSTGPEKTVYGNPKDPFMPPPHVVLGAPVKPLRQPQPRETPQDILDLTCKSTTPPPSKPAVEILRLPTSPSPKLTPHNLTKNYTLVDGKAVVGSNLEITLVNKAQSQSPNKNRPPQKRSSNGKFMSAKTPTPPKETYPKYSSPSHTNMPKKPPITIPNYQIRDDSPPTTSNPLQNALKTPNLTQIMELQNIQKLHNTAIPMQSFMDPYMALYSSLAGQMDQRQLAMYRDLMANQFRGYPGLLNLGVANTPTTKN